MWITIITLSVSLFIYTLIMLLFGSSPKTKIRSRLNKLAENVELEYIHDAVINEKKKHRKEKKKARKGLVVSRRFEESLAMSCINLNAQEYITIWAMLTVLPGLVLSILRINVIAIMGVCLIGFALPPFLVRRSKNKRALLFNKQLGESMTIMGNCIRSGYSFQQAMGSIAREMQPPISTEFARVVREINYGTSMEQALNHMVERVDNKDLELLISAVLTSQQVGANLSEILDTIAETVNDRIKLREEVRVLSSQGRMSGVIIGLLPVAVILFLMIMNPSYFGDFASSSLGRIMLAVSVIMEILGFICINKIVDIKY